MTTQTQDVQRAAGVQQILAAHRAELEQHATQAKEFAAACAAARDDAGSQIRDLSAVLNNLRAQAEDAHKRIEHLRIEMDRHADAAAKHQREADEALAVIGGAEAVARRALATGDRVAAVGGPTDTQRWQPPAEEQSGMYPVTPAVPSGPEATRPDPVMPPPAATEHAEQQSGGDH